MKNFPFTHNNEEYWYSRSCTSVAFIFCKNKNGEWCVLANKRGPSAPTNKGKWNVPCGYVDFGETLKQAAAREAFEETGVWISSEKLHFFHKNDKPEGKKQNITFLYYGVLKGTIDDYPCNLDHMEPGEVSDAQWINLYKLHCYTWAFQHYTKINLVYKNFVNPPFWKKWLLCLYRKLDKYFDIYHD